MRRHRDAFGDAPIFRGMLDVGGEYAVRVRGEDHVWNATTVSTLQHAVRGNSHEKYRAFAKILNEQDTLVTIRGLFRVKTAEEDEPQARAARGGRAGQEHRQRFATGAMSFGSISREAHTTLAIAMNRIGGKSNTGEGGEESRPLQAAAERRHHALGDQAGRLGTLRRHRRVSRQLGHDADQDGAGRQARRRRPVARPQGRQDHRQGAPFDAGRRPDFAAAAPRHLFDRGPGAAHLRPEERQPDRRRLGEARLRGRRRHGRGRRLQGALRPCDDLGLRGRHRRVAPSPRSSTPARRGRSASPRPTRRWSPTGCAAASRCRSTAASAPAATW